MCRALCQVCLTMRLIWAFAIMVGMAQVGYTFDFLSTHDLKEFVECLFLNGGRRLYIEFS